MIYSTLTQDSIITSLFTSDSGTTSTPQVSPSSILSSKSLIYSTPTQSQIITSLSTSDSGTILSLSTSPQPLSNSQSVIYKTTDIGILSTSLFQTASTTGPQAFVSQGSSSITQTPVTIPNLSSTSNQDSSTSAIQVTAITNSTFTSLLATSSPSSSLNSILYSTTSSVILQTTDSSIYIGTHSLSLNNQRCSKYFYFFYGQHNCHSNKFDVNAE